MSTSQVKINPRNKPEIMENQPLRFMSAIYTLKLIFYVKHSRSRQQHGAYIKYSLVKSHQISIWTPVDLFYVIFPLFMNWAFVSVAKIAPEIPYNHTYFLSPLASSSKVAIAYTCKKHCSQGVHGQYFHVVSIVVIAIMVSSAQFVSVGVLFQSRTHSGLQLVCWGPGIWVRHEHV